MEKNQELKLVHDVSRSANVSDNDESVNDKNNDDENPNNNKDENEDNNELEDKENQKRIEIYNDETTESIAFKSQFDEIIYSKKLLENAKPNNYNNNYYYNPHARASSLSSLNGRKVSETENLYFTHQKSYSHSNQYQQQSSKYNHNQAKHKRNNSSIPKLNLSGINNNNSYYPAINRNFMNSLSSTPYIGYDIFDELSFDDAFDLKYSLKELDHSNAKFNNNKYNRYDSDWDLMSSNQGYHTSLLPPPLTPSSIHSSTPSSYSPSLSPYYTPTSAKSSYHHHLFLDDKEFLAQQLLLEEERKLLEMQQIQLNDAIVALRSETENNNDSNNFDPVFKPNLVQTPVTLSVPPTLNSNSSSNSKFKSNASLSHKTSPSQLLNHFSSTLSPPSSSSQSKNCHQEPIGTPFRKHSPSNSNKNNNHNMPNIMPISMSTASSSSTSLSLSSPSSSPTYRHNPNSTFSLFSKLPSLSMNTSNSNISNTSGDPNASNANSTNNNAAADVILTPPSMPITPPITPRDNNNSISYFNPISSLNILNLGNPRPKNNPSNKYHNGPFYNNLRTATTFDEREEDLSLWYSEPFGKKFERPLRFENGNKNNNNISLKHHRHHSRSSGLIV